MDPMEWLLKNRYGSLELSRQMGLNLLRGLAGSVILHGLAVATFIVIALLNGGKPMEIVVPLPPNFLEPPQRPYRIDPPVVPELTRPVPPDVIANPIAVPNEPVIDRDPAPVPTTPGIPGEIRQPGTYTGPLVNDPETVDYGGTVDDIPSSTIFIPREFEPSPLETNPRPVYPSTARIGGMEGKVTVQMYVDASGVVRKWHVLKASPEGFGFEDAVITVIPKWKFAPALQQGKPVGVWISIPFTFTYKK